MIYGADPADPQKIQAYAAQSEVALNHPEHELQNLRAVRRYADRLRQTEGITVGGPFRAWQFTGGGDHLLVDRPMRLGEAAGKSVYIKAMQKHVQVLPWTDRASHYEEYAGGYAEITVGAPLSRPLSHRLLIVHEFAHVGRFGDKHGPVWAAAFLEMVGRQLPDLHADLQAAFVSYGVQVA